MKLNSTFNARITLIVLFVLVGLLTSKSNKAQTSTVCTNPANIIYGLTGTGLIYEINVNTAATGAVIKNSTYSGNVPGSSNGLGYNYANSKFYYFKRNVTSTPQEFVSFEPATNTLSILASSTCANDVHTGCVNHNGSGYYTVDVDGNLNYYNITNNTWTSITSNIVDQNGNNVTSVIQSQNAGDMAIDGWGNIWLVTSSSSNYGLYKFSAPLPTSYVTTLVVARIISPATATPTGQSFAGIAFNPSGQIYLATKSGNRFYKMNDGLSLTSVGTLTTNDVGNDLTSCNFPMIVLPVTWSKFDAFLQGSNIVNLEWELTEENNEGFYIEHSRNGNNWEDIAFIQSKHGESVQAYSYSHINNMNGKQYYRIRQVNVNGKKSYSEIRTIVLKNDTRNISIWPTLATDHIRIVNDGDGNNSFSKAQVFDLSGRMLTEKKLQPSDMNTLNISMLPTGTYILRVQNNNGTACNQKISKQ